MAIERLLGNPTRFELEGCRSEIVLVPQLMVEAVPDGGTVEGMFAALCRGLARVQEEERMRNEYLQRQREKHSARCRSRFPRPRPGASHARRCSTLTR